MPSGAQPNRRLKLAGAALQFHLCSRSHSVGIVGFERRQSERPQLKRTPLGCAVRHLQNLVVQNLLWSAPWQSDASVGIGRDDRKSPSLSSLIHLSDP
jgi:hypothetical protein